ncbi:PIR protein [Plasmodium yoelii]|uniref:PIR protein n=4 Tax=Plasmodium yoelii TaxID=5861 RepID=A0AAE9WTR9_PLAYO|nr:PIR protein [Plasmodium yoelii]XP_034493546.1 PIR protein [Plasmodium yoelii]EAA20772.1 putative yir4 protein [Plasmodium yoelii yoelii]WBY58344.1 PIR protein [Plasmodium yoelii yoelii]WBY60520.1 PIR protein [Plasmodium yoelii yoelii]VTZ79260.1 PIR protein [Plasmodium yoelii]VTZ81297.1 PIR protein [Plasmodium yoelii]|eukprot:XP_022811086.1 PIR protein [Plasmodium yoelii]
MNKTVCDRFLSVWDALPDTLNKGEYEFKKNNFLDGYCRSYSCDNDVEKVNAGFFYLLNKFFGSSESSYSAQNDINVVDYIIIWLSYMLNLKANTREDNLNYFYTISINSDNIYKNPITGIPGYKSYKDLIDEKKELMSISNEKMSKLYALFKILCNIYTELDDKSSNCNKHSGKAIEFVEKYKKIKEDPSVTEGSPYYKLLSTLSKDYDNLKNKCDSFPDLLTIEKKQNFAKSSEDTPSSSSITTKLFTVLSIFGAIGFLLGISYKYSLFGFRKRFQKQKLREKIKNIKKRINH